MMLSSRLKRLRTFLKTTSFDGVIISEPGDIFYFSQLLLSDSKHREAVLFVTHDKAILYHSPFLHPPSHAQIKHVHMRPQVDMRSILRTLYFGSQSRPTIGFQDANLTVVEYERFTDHLSGSILIPLPPSFLELRWEKEITELDCIRKASRITAQTMAHIQDQLYEHESIGMTERAVKIAIEQHLFELGADGLAFPTIVAFGHHSSRPHHVPTSIKLKKNDVVLLDFGCQIAGYMSDMTRTMRVTNTPIDSTYQTVEQTVLGAYAVGIKQLEKPDVTAAMVDNAVRKHITLAGYGHEFIHTTGHGVGISIHESPSIHGSNISHLSPGMVLTVEPGIYLEGAFGYRHENTVLITDTIPEILTTTSLA